MRSAIGGATPGGGIGGALFGLAGTIMVGLEPIVVMVCGVYTHRPREAVARAA